MAQDKPHGFTPLSLDELDAVVGGAGGHPPTHNHGAHKDDALHATYDAAVAAAASVTHAEGGYEVSVHGGQYLVPHPDGGDAAHTLTAASAHLDSLLQGQRSDAVSAGAVQAEHPVQAILGSAWTRAA